MIINGNDIAKTIISRLEKYKKPSGALVAIVVGDDRVSLNFVVQKERVASDLQIDFKARNFSENISEAELISEIEVLNMDPLVRGIILQLPLPKHINRGVCVKAIAKKKDVDCLSASFGSGSFDKMIPPAPGVVREIVNAIHLPLSDFDTAVLGARGFLVGVPVASFLRRVAKSVVELDKDSWDAEALLRADLVVSGMGDPGFVKGDIVKKGAVLIDFGYGETGDNSF